MEAGLPFADRIEAASRLVWALQGYKGTRPLVLAIPRGAVPMGRLIADALDGELDVVLVRKLGSPDNPEFAIGAVDEDGHVMLDDDAARWSGASPAYVRMEADRQWELIRERRQAWCGGQRGIDPTGRTVIVVDDGLATGATMLSALRSLRAHKPARLVCAVPVGSREALRAVQALCDDVVCLHAPRPFGAVGMYYQHFESVHDSEVLKALDRGAHPHVAGPPPSYAVHVDAGDARLDGELVAPAAPRGLVVFAHGSGSSRHSPRNQYVAHALQRRGYATLLFDLLTPAEDRDPRVRFDIPLLTRRLQAAVDWAWLEADRHQPMALFGASTGAAAALGVAAARPDIIKAVISRGGRPDLAGPQIQSQVQSPVLLIVGGADTDVLRLNQAARQYLRGQSELALVPGATHLFEEAGALEQVAVRAGEWLDRVLGARLEIARSA